MAGRKTPKGPPGQLYINRDRDYFSGELGDYVKIGIVKEHETRGSEERRGEHQTGNPREVVIIREFTSRMVEHLETRLHATFALRRVSGEWFVMDDTFVENELYPMIEKMNEQISNDEPFNEQRRLELGNIESNGVKRDPTQDELNLHEQYKAAKERFDRVTANILLVKQKIVRLAGNVGGIEGIVNFQIKTTKASTKIDWANLQKENKDLIEPFISIIEESVGAISGSLLLLNTQSLSEIDEALSNKAKEAEKEIKIPPKQGELDYAARTDELEKAHVEYLSLIGDEFESEVEMLCIKSKLACALGENEEINGIISWKRARKINPEKEDFDKKGFEERYPEIVKKYSSEKPESKTASVEMERQRKYSFKI